jgi:histone H2A
MTTETLTRYDPKLLVGPKRQRRKTNDANETNPANQAEVPAIAPEPASTDPNAAQPSQPAQATPANGTRREVISRSTKAALTMAVARIDALLRDTSVIKRLGAGSPVYFAAVLEYLAGDLLNLAGLVTKEANVRTTKLTHLVRAVKEDSAYRQVCADWLLCMELGLDPKVTLGPESEGDTQELEAAAPVAPVDLAQSVPSLTQPVPVSVPVVQTSA